MLADNIVNCAETADRLQKQINGVDQVCSNTGMLIDNEVIIVRNGGPLRAYESWYLCGVRFK